MFIVKFPDVDWPSYVIFQTIHILHNSYVLVGYQHIFFTVALFEAMIIWYFKIKFAFIGRQIKRLNTITGSKKRRAYNRRLAMLIGDFNTAHVEMLKMRKYFRNYCGCNIVHYFGLSVLVSIRSSIRLSKKEA